GSGSGSCGGSGGSSGGSRREGFCPRHGPTVKPGRVPPPRAAEAREARKAAPRRDRAVEAAGPRASGDAAKAKAKAKPTADPAAAASPPRAAPGSQG
ncbi:unnamed protein product, partial [Rangifer tarandus platyrhynchus]